jgi:hypothetical protein
MSTAKMAPTGQSQKPVGPSRVSSGRNQPNVDHRQVDVGHVCPVCSSGSRCHDLVVTDENGEWQIRLARH